MSDVCPKCGLARELCVCETIAKEDQRVVVKTEKRKFGKLKLRKFPTVWYVGTRKKRQIQLQ